MWPRAGLADRVLPLSLIANEILPDSGNSGDNVIPGDSVTDQDFDMIRKLLYDRSAILLDSDKQYLVESRLAPILRQRNLNSINELVAQLRAIRATDCAVKSSRRWSLPKARSFAIITHSRPCGRWRYPI